MNEKFVEWTGALLGLIGSAMLALNVSVSGFGFLAFLISNLFWLVFGVKKKAWGLVTMQVGFTVTSLMGLYNWLLKPVASVLAT